MPVTNINRTITQVAITQGAAGATDLVSAPGAGLKIYVVGFFVVGDAAGSVTFNEGTGPTALTGVMPIGSSGSLSAFGNGVDPIFSTNTANSKLTITTVTAKAFGWIRYFIDS